MHLAEHLAALTRSPFGGEADALVRALVSANEPLPTLRPYSTSSFACPPLFGEERLERAIEPQEREPSLAGNGLDPVAAFHAVRLRGAEIDHR